MASDAERKAIILSGAYLSPVTRTMSGKELFL
jgi:hypothetical protein